MRADTRRRVADLFEAALDRPAEARGAFLIDACAGAHELRHEVESLLEAYERSDGFLERPDVAQLAALIAAAEASAPLPDVVGPYRVVRELGRGGQGRVFLAERADGQFEQRVAVKLIHGGVSTPDAVARFLRERQILARLRHPAIASLLDGGVTADGQPWFAMECIEGTSITKYCDERRLDLDQRLRLFIDVADAVGHAHRHHIVHRDLKPSNILVTAEGRVKLVDFGIAKPLPGSDDPVTVSAARVLTPEYAAPEQVRGDPVTAASDIYALGAVLYELMTGRRVHRLESYSPLEIAQVVCEREPVSPSRAAGEGARRLRGDLDAIVLKALRKEPERRYASVDALLDDLDRHRRGLPVRARQGSVAYAVRKLVTRHRVRIAMVALLVAFGGALAALASRARLAAREAERMREMERYALTLQEGLHAPADSAGGGPAVPAAAAGRRIVFMSNRLGRGWALYGFEGDSAARLLDNVAQPAWSPDGQQVVFEREGDLFTAAPDGSGLRRLTEGPALDREPAWSPDGRQIAYRSNRGGDISDVWVVDVDGSNPVNLTRHPAFDGQPAWSPDGTRIAFNTDRDGNYEIYVMHRDGSNLRNLTRSPLTDIEPAWSPDGRRIAFPSTRDGNFEVYVMNADGSGVTNLTRHLAADGQPTWSPDGSLLAFASNRRGNGEIYIMRLDGSVLANLSRDPAEDAWPAWRR